MQPVQQALNQLLARVNQLLQQERRFTADAAHELRTPIAGIRAQAQVALASHDMAEQHEALLSALKGCDRAAHTVDQMLQLARLDSASEPLAHTDNPLPTDGPPFDLADCASQVASTMMAAAQNREQTLTQQTSTPCWITGNSNRWAMLVRNLLDNSLRYSPRGAHIVLRVAMHDDQATLDVEDSGPGLTDEQLQRLGERFFRVAGTDTPGSGLGWSIIQRIAQVEGAHLRVGRSTELGGLSVRLQRPVKIR